MQCAHDFIGPAGKRHAHHRPTTFSPLVHRILPHLLRPPLKSTGLLVAFAIGIFFAGGPAHAHSDTFLPVGWSGPWYDGSTLLGHPERLCGLYYPSYACLVASTSYLSQGLIRWPIWVRNNQGLDVLYCTNDRDTRGWIVVIGVPGLSWSFTPIFWFFRECGTPNRCNMFIPGEAGGIASLPWNSSGGTYYQANHHGNYCW
jgi:hypothetical protein